MCPNIRPVSDFRQFCPVMGGKVKAHTVSLAPPNAPRVQNEKKKPTKPSLPFLPYAISKYPFGDLNVA